MTPLHSSDSHSTHLSEMYMYVQCICHVCTQYVTCTYHVCRSTYLPWQKHVHGIYMYMYVMFIYLIWDDGKIAKDLLVMIRMAIIALPIESASTTLSIFNFSLLFSLEEMNRPSRLLQTRISLA